MATLTPPAGTRRRRRRRHGSALRRAPRPLNQHGRGRRISVATVLSCGAVAVTCLALIALIWINTERAVREQQDDTRNRAEAAVSAQAATLMAQAHNELLTIDQSLAILQSAWNSDPDTFNLSDWRKRMPALTAVTDDLFIANDRQLIVQDIVPAAIGQGIGAAYATFANGSLEPIQTDDGHGSKPQMLVGAVNQNGVARQYLMYLVRPLAKPAGWVIGAAYRSSALTQVYASAGLGQAGLTALVDTHRGGVQSVAGIAAVHPQLAIGNSAMYRDMVQRPQGGIWTGRTAIDGVPRIIGFRPVPGRDLLALVGVTTDEAMTYADNWAAAARSLAVIASLLVLALGGTVLWEVWHWRRTQRRVRMLGQTRALLSGVQSELVATRGRAASAAARLRAILASVTEGIAVFDGERRLAAWNPGCAAACGLPGDVLREGLGLADLLRLQAEAGRFGALDDVAAEVARRVALLRSVDGIADMVDAGPGGVPRTTRAETLPDGGLLLIWFGAGDVPPVAAHAAAVPAEETEPADPVEW